MVTDMNAEAWLQLMWHATWQACVLALIVWAVTTVLPRMLPPAWRAVLWAVPMCRLLLPVVPATTFSLFNLFAPSAAEPAAVIASGAPTARAVEQWEPTTGSSLRHEPRNVSETRDGLSVHPSADVPSLSSVSVPLAEDAGEQRAWPSVWTILCAIWVMGMAVSLLLWMQARLALHRIIRRGRQGEPALRTTTETLRSTMGLRRKVQCVVLDDDVGPAACGLPRPKILLPARLVGELTPAQLRIVVLHEMEHIRRGDGVLCGLSRAATCIHWFNPLAYLLSNQLRHEVELAVDAATVARLGEPMRQSYGELLVGLAARRGAMAGLSPMASSRSNAYRRIDALASPVPQGMFSSTLAVLVVLLTVTCGLTDAARAPLQDQREVQAEAVTQSGDESERVAPRERGTETALQPRDNPADPAASLDERIARIRQTANWGFISRGFLDRIEQRQAKLQGVRFTLRGDVRDHNNKSVAGALVVLRLVSNSSKLYRDGNTTEDVFAVGWTNDTGAFEFLDQRSPWVEAAYPVSWELCVYASGYALETRHYGVLDQRTREEHIRLQPARTIEVTIRDDDGNPVAGIPWCLLEIVNPYTAELEHTVFFSELLVYTRSTADGKIRIGGLPPERIASLAQPYTRWQIGRNNALHFPTSDDINFSKLVADNGRPTSNRVHPIQGKPFDIMVNAADIEAAKTEKDVVSRSPTNIGPTRRARVRVVDAESGQGVSQVAVGWRSKHDGSESIVSPRTRVGMLVTDENGVADLQISKRSGEIYICGRRFGYVTPYNPISTDPDEYTPPVERSYWVKSIAAAETDVEVQFEIQPVPPLQITTRTRDGTPVAARVVVSQHDWIDPYRMPEFWTNEQGQATVAIRPAMFDIDITATTEDGLRGSRTVHLSKDLTQPEAVTVIVQP